MPYTSEFTGPEIDARLNLALTVLEELVAARGGRSSLAARLEALTNIATPNPGGFVAGRYYDQSINSASAGTTTSGVNRCELTPFMVGRPFSFDQVGVHVSTAAAGQARIVIYDTGPDGWPNNRLFQSVGLMDTATPTGFKALNEAFTFEPNRLYWIGVHTSAAPVLTAVSQSGTRSYSLMSSTATGGSAYASVLRQTFTFADGCPATWTFSSGQLQTGLVASIRMRAA
jgi:hypothetical protein